MEMSNRSETPNKRVSRLKSIPAPQGTINVHLNWIIDILEQDNNEDGLKLTQENLAAYQSLYKPVDTMSKLKLQDNQNLFKDVASVKSFGLDSPPSPFNKVTILTVYRVRFILSIEFWCSINNFKIEENWC